MDPLDVAKQRNKKSLQGLFPRHGNGNHNTLLDTPDSALMYWS